MLVVLPLFHKSTPHSRLSKQHSTPWSNTQDTPHTHTHRSTEATIAVLGDLHMQPKDEPLFQQAADQLAAVVAHPTGRVVQLGDLGGYNNGPGSAACFATANQWLATLHAPTLLVVGNHDLEGEEFATDEDNLGAWQQARGAVINTTINEQLQSHW